jgi:NADH dehydrogenase FAD-containing subunit
MNKHLVLVGGGHAHMTVMLKLSDFVQKGNRVTLISPSSYHYYSGMGPGMLSGTYSPQDIRFNVKKMVEDRGAVFVEDRVVRIDAPQRTLHLASGKKLKYDVVSFNTGSSVPLDKISPGDDRIIPVKPIINLVKGRQKLLDALEQGPQKIVVLGGGPAGVEIAGNLWSAAQNRKYNAEITLLAGSKILKEHPLKVGDLTIFHLKKRGIQIIQGLHAVKLDQGKAELSDGNILDYDLAFAALGVTPSPIFRESGLPVGEDGGLLVNSYLQSVEYPEIFGGGDCISFQERTLAKVGVYAVRENPILFHNLLSSLEETQLIPFEPQKEYLLILNLGNKTGIFHRKNIIFHGRPAFLIKNWIDQRFMKTFQVSGEREEMLDPDKL